MPWREQGSITNSISAPDLALMEEPNHTEETKGGSATASWAPSGAPAQCSEISAEILMTQQTACAASAQTGSDGLPSPPSNESATQSGQYQNLLECVGQLGLAVQHSADWHGSAHALKSICSNNKKLKLHQLTYHLFDMPNSRTVDQCHAM